MANRLQLPILTILGNVDTPVNNTDAANKAYVDRSSGSASILGVTDPTTTTTGIVGQFYVNTTTSNEFVCTAINTGTPTTYTWLLISSSAGTGDVSSSPKSYGTNLQIANTTGNYTLGHQNNLNAMILEGIITYGIPQDVGQNLSSNTAYKYDVTGQNAFYGYIGTASMNAYPQKTYLGTSSIKPMNQILDIYTFQNSAWDETLKTMFVIGANADNFTIGVCYVDNTVATAPVVNYINRLTPFVIQGPSTNYLTNILGFSAVYVSSVGSTASYLVAFSGSSGTNDDSKYYYTNIITVNVSTLTITIVNTNWTRSPIAPDTIRDLIYIQNFAYLLTDSGIYKHDILNNIYTKIIPNSVGTGEQIYLSNNYLLFSWLNSSVGIYYLDTNNVSIFSPPTTFTYSGLGVWGLYIDNNNVPNITFAGTYGYLSNWVVTVIVNNQILINEKLNINQQTLTNLLYPVNPLDAVSKKYVDDNFVYTSQRSYPKGLNIGAVGQNTLIGNNHFTGVEIQRNNILPTNPALCADSGTYNALYQDATKTYRIVASISTIVVYNTNDLSGTPISTTTITPSANYLVYLEWWDVDKQRLWVVAGSSVSRTYQLIFYTFNAGNFSTGTTLNIPATSFAGLASGNTVNGGEIAAFSVVYQSSAGTVDTYELCIGGGNWSSVVSDGQYIQYGQFTLNNTGNVFTIPTMRLSRNYSYIVTDAIAISANMLYVSTTNNILLYDNITSLVNLAAIGLGQTSLIHLSNDKSFIFVSLYTGYIVTCDIRQTAGVPINTINIYYPYSAFTYDSTTGVFGMIQTFTGSPDIRVYAKGTLNSVAGNYTFTYATTGVITTLVSDLWLQRRIVDSNYNAGSVLQYLTVNPANNRAVWLPRPITRIRLTADQTSLNSGVYTMSNFINALSFINNDLNLTLDITNNRISGFITGASYSITLTATVYRNTVDVNTNSTGVILNVSVLAAVRGDLGFGGGVYLYILKPDTTTQPTGDNASGSAKGIYNATVTNQFLYLTAYIYPMSASTNRMNLDSGGFMIEIERIA